MKRHQQSFAINQPFEDIRNDEVIQAICEHHIDKLTLCTRRTSELERCQKEDDKVEGHAVDECGGEELAIRRCNSATLAGNPFRSQQDTVK